MNVSIKEIDDIVVVGINDSILQESVALLKTRLNDLIEDGKVWIVLDMSLADYLSSMGVAVMVEIKKCTVQSGGDLKLANVNQLTRNLLEYTHVDKKIEVFETVDKAVESIRAKRKRNIEE